MTYVVSSGTDDESHCGYYTLSAFLLQQGGLEGYYYANRWFSSDPYKTQVDADINHQWSTGDLLESVASNYVSIEWNGFLEPPATGDYVFEANFNDGLQLWINDVLVIDKMEDVSDELNGWRIATDPIQLIGGTFVPIRIRYYEAKDAAFVTLSWKGLSGETTIPEYEVVPSSALYYKRSHTPISGASTLIETSHTPRRPTNVHQSDSSTYAADSITLEWDAPADTGCSAILDYKIQWYNPSTAAWEALTDVEPDSTATIGVASSLEPGVLVDLRVLAVNENGEGAASETITLTPAALPGPSSTIQVDEYSGNYLMLSWAVPTDTGATAVTIVSY